VQLTASFDVDLVNLPAQFRQVWRCHFVQTLVDHDAKSERDARGRRANVGRCDECVSGEQTVAVVNPTGNEGVHQCGYSEGMTANTTD